MKTFFTASLFCILFSVTIFAQKAEQIEEFTHVFCDDYLARMDGILVQARDNPSANIYVFFYDGKESVYDGRTEKFKFIFPARGSTEAKTDSMKKYAAYRKASVENFKFINAGFREKSTVEVWIVPKNVEPPKPAPTLNKMKYRKGKAKGFCVSCC